MQVKTFRIGRAPDNDTVLSNSDISSNHATITQLQDGNYEVEDLGSTNGTYVNGYRIKKATIGVNDELRLSASLVIDPDKIFKGINPVIDNGEKRENKKNFVKPFAHLESTYLTYIRERKALIDANRKKMAIKRGLISFLPMVIILILMNIPGYEVLRNMTMGVMILASTAGNILVKGDSIEEELEKLDYNQRIRYVCPNCRQAFGNKVPWQTLYDTGFCPNHRCGAIFNESKL